MLAYKFFLLPIITLIINQIIKITIYTMHGEFSWNKIFSYGGMPSSHSALATSLVIGIGYYHGIETPSFAIALIIAIVIIKDAFGIRRKVGQQNQILNRLVKDLPDKEKYKFPVLNERFGHSYNEIVVGILVGNVCSAAAIAILS